MRKGNEYRAATLQMRKRAKPGISTGHLPNADNRRVDNGNKEG